MKLSVRIPDDTHRELKLKAIEKGVTLQSILIEAIRRLLDKFGDPTLEITKEDWVHCNDKRAVLKSQGLKNMEPLTYAEFLRRNGV